MSSWGYRTFEDDLACDWLEDLLESDPLAFFAHCLDLSDQDALAFIACVGVVCTAEMLHLLLIGPREKMPQAALSGIPRDQASLSSYEPLLPLAIAGVDRVLDRQSEMYLRWEDAGEEPLHLWLSNVQSLRSALTTHLTQLQ